MEPLPDNFIITISETSMFFEIRRLSGYWEGFVKKIEESIINHGTEDSYEKLIIDKKHSEIMYIFRCEKEDVGYLQEDIADICTLFRVAKVDIISL